LLKQQQNQKQAEEQQQAKQKCLTNSINTKKDFRHGNFNHGSFNHAIALNILYQLA